MKRALSVGTAWLAVAPVLVLAVTALRGAVACPVQSPVQIWSPENDSGNDTADRAAAEACFRAIRATRVFCASPRARAPAGAGAPEGFGTLRCLEARQSMHLHCQVRDDEGVLEVRPPGMPST